MSFFKKLFGSNKQPFPEQNDNKSNEPAPDNPTLKWIEAADNPWKVRMLDVQPITQTMVSTSKDRQQAANAVSFRQEDGKVFWGQRPATDRTIETNISFSTDKILPAGILFTPMAMEFKWAIFFDGKHIIFVRSWLRMVAVVATTRQTENELVVEQIHGEFTQNESPEYTIAVLQYLLINHAMREIVPAPLPKEFEKLDDLQKAYWIFSAFGKMAYYVHIADKSFELNTIRQLRSVSLLHVAAARRDVKEIEQQVQKGMPLDYMASDGLRPLHYALKAKSTECVQKLLQLGANPNAPSIEGFTPLMEAVYSGNIESVKLLLHAGVDINARDHKGFTSLHRAAGEQHEEIVALLLQNGADKTIEAQGHPALSLAELRGNEKIIALLK